VFVDVLENVCKDMSDKNNLASETFSITYNTIEPEITITSHTDNQKVT